MNRFFKRVLAVTLLGLLGVHAPALYSAQTGAAKQSDSWNTSEDLDKMGSNLRVLFEDFLNKEAGELRRTTGKSFYNLSGPAIDVFETADELIVQCDVPGFDKKDVGVELSNNVLIIRGKKPQAAAVSHYFVQERWHDVFERKVPLPVVVSGDNVKAEQINGVLTVYFSLKNVDAKSVKVKIA